MAQDNNQKRSKSLLQFLVNHSAVIFIILFLMLILSVTALIVVANRMDVSKDTFGRTITDTILTIISTGIIGTILAMLLANYKSIQSKLEKEREERQLREKNRDQYRKDSLDKLNKSYAKTKNARRMLRAKGFIYPNNKDAGDDNLLILSEYDLFMDDINDSQLQLEDIRGQISTNQSAFSNPGILVTNLESMDDYLGKLIRDYETFRPGFNGNPPTRKIGDFPDTKSFLAHGGEEFKTNFSTKCKDIRAEIRRDINLFNK